MESSEPIDSITQLAEYIAQGEKPRRQWRIGTEHEKFVFDLHNVKRARYGGERGIEAIMRQMGGANDVPITENGCLIGWKLNNGGSITLEPGGQFELSGAPLETIHQTCDEINQHLETLRPVCHRLGLTMVGIGHDPISRREDVEWMPKGRYQIMRQYMPTRGKLGIDMMIRTCTVQVNLDYENAQDMREKMRIAATFQPIATALFANSPLKEGRLSGLQSTRAHCWSDTDPDRTGIPAVLFEPHFDYAQWVDYALSVPMYFLYDNGAYHDVAGADFRDFVQGKRTGKLKAFAGRQATMRDWEDHLTVAFPEVRLKRFIEMRGADGGRWDDLLALPAFWVGLLYDSQAQAEALALAEQYGHRQIVDLNAIVPAQGLTATLDGQPITSLAKELVEIAQRGLVNRARCNSEGDDESGYLHPLCSIVESGVSSADKLRRDYLAACKGGHINPHGQGVACQQWLLNRLRN